MLMKRVLLTGALLVPLGGVAFTTPQPAPVARTSDTELATIKQYCATCHNDRIKAGAVSFDGLTPESIGQHRDVFEKAVRKLRGRVMPPPGARQPDAAFVDSLAVGGQTGTLQHEMNGTIAQGNCRGKTGTLSDVASLAGYCRARDGHTLAFAFLANGVGSTSYVHGVEATMAVALAGYNG